MSSWPCNFLAERNAEALAMAAYTSDAKAAEYFGVSTRSIENWRKRLNDWPDFAELFAEKKQAYTNQWADQLGPTMRETLIALRRAATAATFEDEKASPEIISARADMVRSLAGSLKMLAEVQGIDRVLTMREDKAAEANTRRNAPNVRELSDARRTG